MNNMKIKYIINSFLLSAFALTAFSCIEDLGNYTYKETNVVEFTGLVGLEDDGPYEIFLGEPVTIKPEMTQTVPTDENDYTYYWLRMGSRETGVRFDTVHVGKYMEDYSVPLAPRTAPYTMVYQAKNNVTGVTYSSEYFYFKVIGDITSGYLLLHEDDGKPLLKFYNYKASRFEERTIDLSPLGDDLGKPLQILTFPDIHSPMINTGSTDGYAVALLTESGLYRLKYDDFTYEDAYNIKFFIFGDEPADFRIQEILTSVNKGVNTYTALLKDQNGDYMNYAAASNAYYLIPWTYGIMCNSYMVGGVRKRFTPGLAYMAQDALGVFYDVDSRSIAYKEAGLNYCKNYSVSKEEKFKFNNVDYTPIAFIYQFYGPKMAAEGYRVHMIVKTDAGDYKLRAWSTHSTNLGGQLIDANLNVTDIENAKYFATTYAAGSGDYSSYGTLYYYATDKKVYCFNLTNATSTEVYTAPDGNVIASIKVEVKTTLNCPFLDHLVISTNSESGAETSTFEIFTITPLTGAIAIKKDVDGNELRWTGLPKIVGLDWKGK